MLKDSAALRLIVVALFVSCAACSRRPPPPEFQPTSTVKDIMDSLVDPSADGIWDSVEMLATIDGIQKKEPRTDDDWKALRRHAIALVEAGNLLLIPGRHIAQPGETAEDARVDLHPEEIEALVVRDPATWARHARGLHDAALLSLQAIDRRDVAELLDAGDDLDEACENCHRTYWYRDIQGSVPPLPVEAELAPAAFDEAATGTIRGHVAFAGRPPGNPVIRMGMDPKCADLTADVQVLQEEAVVAADGSVANAFVRLAGNFAATPVPQEAVVIDQRGCVYGPRVVGMRVGQTLRVLNSDDVLHNVHSSSAVGNSFNVGQPAAGARYEFTPASEEVMMKIGCDVHRWMTAWVGVVPHPYFAVSDRAGAFEIRNVPPGTYTIVGWHETFGEILQQVTVRQGATATVEFVYVRPS